MKKLLLFSLFAYAICALLVPVAASAGYQIRELQPAAGTASMGCVGWINAAAGSRLAGAVYESGVSHAAVSNAQGDMLLLEAGFALGVNSGGEAVGYSDGAAYWDAAGNLTHLLLPTDTRFSQANDINGAGQIVGECAIGTSSILNYIMLWNGLGQPINLGQGSGRSINSSGSVAGYTQDATGARHAFIWTADEGLAELSGGLSSEANSLNDAGEAAGRLCDSAGGWACVWDAGRSPKLLANLPDAYGSTAWSINNAGAVVGSCDTANGTYAVLWQPDGSLVNLGLLPGHLASVAYGISDSGEVAGCSVDDTGIPHAVAWTAVPEPTSAFAIIAGLLGLLPRLRNQRHNQS